MVIVTAHGSIPDVVATMRLGVADSLPRPVSPANLREVVVGVLVRRGVGGRGPAIPACRMGPQPALFVEDPARARQALGRHEREDADSFLRIAGALRPGSDEVGRLRDNLGQGRAAAKPNPSPGTSIRTSHGVPRARRRARRSTACGGIRRDASATLYRYDMYDAGRLEGVVPTTGRGGHHHHPPLSRPGALVTSLI